MPRLRFFAAIILTFIIPFSWDSLSPWMRYFSLGVLILGIASWLVLSNRQSLPFSLPKIVYPIAALLLIEIIALFKSPLSEYQIAWIVYGGVLLLYLLFVIDSRNLGWKPQTWELALIFSGFLVCLFGLVYLYYWYNDWWNILGQKFAQPPIGIRINILTGHPNLLAANLNILIPLVLIRVLRPEKKVYRIFWILILLMFLVVEYFTASRGGWLGLAGGIALLLGLLYFPVVDLSLHTAKDNPLGVIRPKRLFWLGSGLLVACLALFVLQYRLMGVVSHGAFSDRLALWQYAWKLIQASPWFGHSPGMIPFLYALRQEGIGGDEVFHSHNLWLQITAADGVIGLALGLWALFLVVRAFLSSWKRESPGSPGRDSLAAYAAIGFSILIHSMVDFVFWRMVFMIPTFVILGLFYLYAPRQEVLILRKQVVIPAIAGMAFAIFAGTMFFLRGQTAYWVGLSEMRAGNWIDSRDKFCQASQENSQASYLKFQCALGNAIVSYYTGDTQPLEEAIQFQQAALAQDPYWYLHWANLASYEWQLEQTSQAIEHMQRATEMAPKLDFLWLNLGWMEERLGNVAGAQNYYHTAGCLNPWYRNNSFFTQSTIRLEAFSGKCPAENDNLANSPWLQDLWNASQALFSKNDRAAEAYLHKSIEKNPQNSRAYAALAQIELSQGDYKQAWRDIQTSLKIDSFSPTNLQIAAQITRQLGEEVQFETYMWNAFEFLAYPQLSRRYAIQAYRMQAPAMDVSPYLIRGLPNPELLQSMRLFAQDLHDQGQIDRSRQIFDWIDRVTSSEKLLRKY